MAKRKRSTTEKSENASKRQKTHEKYNFVDIELAKQFEELAAVRGVSKVARGVQRSTQSSGGFFEHAKRLKGNVQKLRSLPIRPGSEQNWWQRRENFCKRHRGQMKRRNEPILETDGPFEGTPTRRELGMLMWMCSNFSESELRDMLPQVRKVVSQNK